MKTKLLLLMTLVFLAGSLPGQSLSKKDLSQLQLIFYDFLTGQDLPELNDIRKSELFVCLLDLDSGGKVNAIHLLSDEKSIDTAYLILHRLTPADFKAWRSEKCKGKTLIIPILSIVPGNIAEHIKRVKKSYSSRLYIIDPLKILNETKSLITISPFVHTVPK